MPQPWIVLKFGGTSVSSRESWDVIAQVVRARSAAGRVLVVHSALGGVSDSLAALGDLAIRGVHEAAIAEIEARHRALARDLEIEDAVALGEPLDELRRLTAGISLVREVTPRMEARLLAAGELLATTLGATFLATQGLTVTGQDARTLLTSRLDAPTPRAHYLAATCDPDPDPDLRARLESLPGVVLTQGFLAQDPRGDTVVFGRGGSDTSAAYLAAKLEATRLEIWTDVPGMFTADPRIVPSARLLRQLDYAEAQEMATTGSKVLHPRCLPVVRGPRIPVHLRWTARPEVEGTVIRDAVDSSDVTLKAISVRAGIVLVSMETLGMWQEVGFLADAFQCFKRHGVSIDLVSTSETNVTVSLDGRASELDAAAMDAVVADLTRFCKVRVIGPCAAVSLVGHPMRANLHKLGPVLEVFREQRVHLLSQAASDLNMTFVVDETQAAPMVQRLHDLVVRHGDPDPVFGPSWERFFHAADGEEQTTAEAPWWRSRRDELMTIARDVSPAYVYDLATVRRRVEMLRGLRAVHRVFYAMKANGNADLVRTAHAAGASIECVSAGEVTRVFEVIPDLRPDEVLFTPNFAPRDEYALAVERGVLVTLDNLYPLRHWPDLFRGCEVYIRIDPGWGLGHHEKVITAGVGSKFGVPLRELEELRELADEHEVRVVGLHAHAGSGIVAPEHWMRVGQVLNDAARAFPHVRSLNVGGGLGVPDDPSDRGLDLTAFNAGLERVAAANDDREIWVEPGRFIAAQAGVLLTTVTQLKGKADMRYVGVDTGMNSLIRPALYGARHPVVNLTRLGEPATEAVTVVGPICETGDRLAVDHLLPPTKGGDVLLIGNAGAYGFVMSSRYNEREPAREVVV